MKTDLSHWSIGFRRVMALLLAVSMVLIPVHFPSVAQAEAPAGQTEFIADDFSDERYISGLTYKWHKLRGTPSMTVKNGKLELASVGGANTICLTAKDASGKEYSLDWSDYSVEMTTNDTNIELYGRVQSTTSVAGSYPAGYQLMFNSAGTGINLFTVEEDGKTRADRKEVASGIKKGDTYTLKVTFSGNSVRVYINDEEKINVNREAYAAGGVALNIPTGVSSAIDNFRVTAPDGTVLFQDDCDNGSYITGVTKSWETEGSWAVSEGEYVGEATSGIARSFFLAENGQGTSDVTTLTNYRAEVDIKNISGSASLAFRVSKTGRKYSFYEAVLSAGKIELYKVVNGIRDGAPLASAAQSLDLSKAHKLRVTADGSTFTIFVDGARLLSYTDKNSPLLKGSVGFRVLEGAATFDNFRVYSAYDAPVFGNLENGMTYCKAHTASVSDADGDLASVTIDGKAVAVNEKGEFAIGTSNSVQTITATDRKGNAVTYKVTVKDGHSPGPDDGDCTTEINCTACGMVVVGAKAWHSPIKDDGDCTTVIHCSSCHKVVTPATAEHKLKPDDGDPNTPRECSLCGFVIPRYDGLIASEGKTDLMGDTFADDRYTGGLTTKWACTNSNATLSLHSNRLSVNNLKDGKPSGASDFYLTNKDASGKEHTMDWTDYTVEGYFTDYYTNLYGRVQLDKPMNGGYYQGYYVTANGSGSTYLFKVTENARIVLGYGVRVISQYWGHPYTYKLVFDGNHIMFYANGDLMIEAYDDTFSSGSVAVNIPTGVEYEMDNIQVTSDKGEVLYYAGFNDLALVQGGVLNKWEPTGSWRVDDGVYVGDATGGKDVVSIFTQKNPDGSYKTDNYDDYCVETDVKNLSGNAAMSLLGRVTKAGSAYSYYEAQITDGKVELYKVVNGTRSNALASVDKKLDLSQSYNLKLVMEGAKIKVILNAEEVLTYEDKDAPLLAGAAGVKAGAGSKASFDNFVAYLARETDIRRFNHYPFDMPSMSQLDATWNVTGDWSVGDKRLQNNGDSIASAILKPKMVLDNYSADLTAYLPTDGKISVLGRYTEADKNGYELSFDMKNGLVLTKLTGGKAETLLTASIADCYLQGALVLTDAKTVLRLEMRDGLLECFINGIYIAEYTDESYYKTGISGFTVSKGVKVESFANADLTGVDNIVIVENEQGEPLKPITVPLGKTPDIIGLYLQVNYFNGNVEYILLDRVEVGAFDGSSLGEKVAQVSYGRRKTMLKYTVIDRTEEINKIKDEISKLDISAIKREDQEKIADLASRYNDLSAVEKQQVSQELKDKIWQAQEAIEFILYPETKDYDVVFRDEYDTPDSIDQYTWDQEDTGFRFPGCWYVENGHLYQYANEEPGNNHYAAAVVDNRNFITNSISVDFAFLNQKGWTGLNFCHDLEKRWTLRVTNKTEPGYVDPADPYVTIPANRVTAYKTGTGLFQEWIYDQDELIQIGEWHNLRCTLVNNVVRFYFDGELLYSYEDKATQANPYLLTEGMAGLMAAEGWAKFDNLVVRGEEVPVDKDAWNIGNLVNTDLPEVKWADDFEDEEVGTNPSHWIEYYKDDRWLVREEAGNKFYGSKGAAKDDFAMTWLSVFDKDVDYTLKFRVSEAGEYPEFGMITRFNARESFVNAGYDFTLQKFFIKVQLAKEFELVSVYSDVMPLDVNKWYQLRLVVEGRKVCLYAEDGDGLSNLPVVQADAGTKVGPGRIGVYTEYCDVDIDDVDIVLLSGQSHVQDGVLEYRPDNKDMDRFIIVQFRDDLVINSSSMISKDNGLTWVVDENNEYTFGAAAISPIDLEKGIYMYIYNTSSNDKSPTGQSVTGYCSYLSTDFGKTWVQGGTLPTDMAFYSQPQEHLNVVKLDNGVTRIFFTAGRQSDLPSGRAIISEVYYTDDLGKTWHASKNSPADVSQLARFCETFVIKNTAFEGRPLMHITTYNSSNYVRYALSYDNGETWEGDYADLRFPCGMHSCVYKEDPYNPGTYYLLTVFNHARTTDLGFPRNRISLFRSTDGWNWDFLCDVERWGDISSGNKPDIFQNVNMNLGITEDYLFPSYSRSESFGYNANGHAEQESAYFRFEKSKLEAQPWPQEYRIRDKEILYTEVVPTNTEVLPFSRPSMNGAKLWVYYYDGTKKVIDISDKESFCFVSYPEADEIGEARVSVDYTNFRAQFKVNVIDGEAPYITDVANGRTYCEAHTLRILDSDLTSVTVNGQEVTLEKNKLTIQPAEGPQTIVATDAAGHVSSVTITVRDGHRPDEDDGDCTTAIYCLDCAETLVEAKPSHVGGTATAEKKAVCEVCGKEYGELLQPPTNDNPGGSNSSNPSDGNGGSNAGIIILCVVLVLVAAGAAVVFLVPGVREKLFAKKAAAATEEEAAEAPEEEPATEEVTEEATETDAQETNEE